jgi:hypothetical protein
VDGVVTENSSVDVNVFVAHVFRLDCREQS